jgi:hypothetical protein
VESVYSAVRTESLYKTDTLRLQRVNYSRFRVSTAAYTRELTAYQDMMKCMLFFNLRDRKWRQEILPCHRYVSTTLHGLIIVYSHHSLRLKLSLNLYRIYVICMQFIPDVLPCTFIVTKMCILCVRFGCFPRHDGFVDTHSWLFPTSRRTLETVLPHGNRYKALNSSESEKTQGVNVSNCEFHKHTSPRNVVNICTYINQGLIVFEQYIYIYMTPTVSQFPSSW